ncbi:hypothetical protein Taro_044293 [Colocasia esculenta]|uniref:Uncharacterized protein n=1 Tax=Colocasia esculenta TaxID=4460 RepID=A0A843X2E7_COLES|nr:hypothetical protein [Colocasia esculenta]
MSASSTTKVIMPDGELREFAGVVTAGQVLWKEAPGNFVCDADDMEFDDYVATVGADEALRSGGLYFVLPRSMLKRRLQPQEMAALAVKASAALAKAGAALGGGTREEEGAGARRVVPVGGFSVGSGVAQKRGKRNGRACSFGAKLGAIPE